MSELKPCPFCGGEAELIMRGNDYIGYTQTEIKCKSCLTKQSHKWIKFKFDRDFVFAKTVELWNRRVTDGTKRKAD